MTEYIERAAAMESIIGLTIVDPAVAQYANAVCYNLQNLPAADVAPVVHGKWGHTHTSESYFNECWRCSACGFDDTEGFGFKFCPNCGAKMDQLG